VFFFKEEGCFEAVVERQVKENSETRHVKLLNYAMAYLNQYNNHNHRDGG